MDMTTLGKVIGTGKYIWFPPTILPFPVSRSKVQEQDGPRSPHCMRWPRHESVSILSFFFSFLFLTVSTFTGIGYDSVTRPQPLIAQILHSGLQMEG